MKKCLLLSFTIIPLIFSCNNTPKGFPEPFPNDEYNPIGFDKFAQDEQITRTALSSQETARIIATTSDCDYSIYQHDLEIHRRDYTRAFAGEFQEGYDIANIKEDIFETTYRNGSNNKRTVSEYNSQTIRDYAFGRSDITRNYNEYIYFASNNGTIYNEATKDAASYVIKTTVEENDKSGELLITKSGPWDENALKEEFTPINLKQSEVFDSTTYNSYSTGADSQNKIVLIKQTREDYQDPDKEEGEDVGIYETYDGRRYLAKQNTVEVIQLVSQGSWYLLTKFRRYNEIAITSEIIEPNVPISMRGQKIIIHYEETIHNFYVDEQSQHTVNIPTNVEINV